MGIEVEGITNIILLAILFCIIVNIISFFSLIVRIIRQKDFRHAGKKWPITQLIASIASVIIAIYILVTTSYDDWFGWIIVPLGIFLFVAAFFSYGEDRHYLRKAHFQKQ